MRLVLRNSRDDTFDHPSRGLEMPNIQARRRMEVSAHQADEIKRRDVGLRNLLRYHNNNNRTPMQGGFVKLEHSFTQPALVMSPTSMTHFGVACRPSVLIGPCIQRHMQWLVCQPWPMTSLFLLNILRCNDNY